MFDQYQAEEHLKWEREERERALTRRAAWGERKPRRRSERALGGLRRRLARVLVALADRLQPPMPARGPAGQVANGRA